MISYEVLNRAADAYNPSLGIAWLALVGHALVVRHWRIAFTRIALGVGCLLIAYGFMWLDNSLRLWPAIGLDYSTHTAVAFALCTVLSVLLRHARILVAVSFVGYLALMLYQRYHTTADIASTLLAVAGPISFLAYTLTSTPRLVPREA